MKENEPDFNELLSRIQNGSYDDSTNEANETPTDESINDYVIEKGSELLNSSIYIIDKVKGRIATAHDSDEINALSSLLKSANSILSTLTSISIQNKKDKTSKDLLALKSNKSQKKLPNTVNNTVILGTREDVFKKILEASNSPEYVSDAPYNERKDDDNE